MDINYCKMMDTLNRLTLPSECWLPIDGTESRYLVSNMGRILTMSYKNKKGTDGMRIMKPALDANGYLRTMVKMNGRYKTIKVHRIVAEAFIQNYFEKPQVNHIDNNRANNKASNLEWVTFKENIAHMMNQGRQTFNNGEKNGKSILTEDIVRKIRMEYKPYVVMMKDLAQKYGVKTCTIKDILTGRSWMSVV